MALTRKSGWAYNGFRYELTFYRNFIYSEDENEERVFLVFISRKIVRGEWNEL
jgi:hypothetical protein